MLLNLFKQTLELPKRSHIVTQPYVDFLARQFELSHSGFHGVEHWFRVLINGRLIARETGADIDVLEHFALIHDVMRNNEDEDIQHGNRAAEFIGVFANDWIHLSSDQIEQLKEAVRYHSMGRLTRDITIQSCWDADRLDLGRVGIRPNSTYLGTKIARDPEFLEAAYQRSKQRFVDYSFRR